MNGRTREAVDDLLAAIGHPDHRTDEATTRDAKRLGELLDECDREGDEGSYLLARDALRELMAELRARWAALSLPLRRAVRRVQAALMIERREAHR